MFSTITYPDGRPFECDTRTLLKRAVSDAAEARLSLFLRRGAGILSPSASTKNGRPTKQPYDEAGYMDLAPDEQRRKHPP